MVSEHDPHTSSTDEHVSMTPSMELCVGVQSGHDNRRRPQL